MHYSEALAELLHDGTDSLWRAVKAMPEEKIAWQPAPEARNARAILEEIAMTTDFSAKLIETKAMPEMGGSEEVKSLEQLEKEHRAAVEEVIKAIKGFKDDELQDTITLPWGEMTFLQVIAYPYWNLMYHWGQISYIQTMYGDKEMH